MEKEFIIKATTPEAIETMLGSAKSALMDDIGTAFLPAYKEFGLSMIGFIRGIRENMPELTKLAESLGKLASRGVEKLGTAMNWALPYIQKGLDYLLNNGEQVAHIIGILAATFAGMKLAPAAEGLLSGVGGMLFGGNAAGGGKRSGGLFGGIKHARFRRQVTPGDVLELECTILKQKGPVAVAEAKATVGGQLAVSAELTFALAKDL